MKLLPHVDKKDFFTIPNLLTYFRFLMVPVFLVLYLLGTYQENRVLTVLGIAAIALSSLSDMFDGMIARKFNQVTELGKALDPVADKVMQFAICVAVCLVYRRITGNYYLWFLVGFFLIKEFVQLGFIWAAWRHGQYLNGAKWYGKVSTFVFDVVMIFLLVLPLFVTKEEFGTGWRITLDVLIGFTFAMLFFALIMYIAECVKQMKEGKNSVPPSLYKDWYARYGKDARKKKGDPSQDD